MTLYPISPELIEPELEPYRQASSRLPGARSRRRRLPRQWQSPTRLLQILVIMLVSMFIFELTKQLVFKHLTLWQSHAITIVFSSVMATAAGHVILRKHQRLGLRLLREAGEREQAQRDLQLAHSVLEQRVVQRTSELQAEIRERRQAQDELRHAHERLQSMMDNLPQAIFWKDAHSVYLGCNRRCMQEAGLEGPEQIVGKTDEDLPWTVDNVVFNREVEQRVLSTGVAECHVREWHGTQDGSPTRWMEMTTLPIHDAGGEAVGILGTWEDVTERRQMQGQLMQAEKLAALGEMIAGVVHEINNPLAAISGSAQLLQFSEDERVRRKADTIVRMTDRTTRIVRSMLDFARSGSEARQVSTLSALVEATLEMCAYKMNRAEVEIVVCLPADLPPLMVNENHIQQVLFNLLVNAEHALRDRPADGRRIVLAAEAGQDTEGQHWLTLHVTDNGCGMPADVQQRIFNPFFTTKEVGEGTGLSICHGIVEAHQGTLSVQSRVGEGTTFTLRLPALGEETDGWTLPAQQAA